MKTELLSPAGSLKNMRYAFAYGADAVYAGQPRYSEIPLSQDVDVSYALLIRNLPHAKENITASTLAYSAS